MFIRATIRTGGAITALALVATIGAAAPAGALDDALLDDTSTVSGTVRLDDGSPAAGVWVHFEGARATTDESGRFTLPTYPGGQDILVVRQPRHGLPGLPSRFRVVWRSPDIGGTELLAITLPPVVQQEFQVVEADGRPAASGSISDATPGVWNRALGGGSASGMGAGTVFQRLGSIASGSTVPVFADPQYEDLKIQGTPQVPEGWGTSVLWRQVSEIALGATQPVEVSLPRTGVVKGQIRSEDGTPLPSDVTFYAPDAVSAQAPPAADGRFRFLTKLGASGGLSVRGTLSHEAGTLPAPGRFHWSGSGTVATRLRNVLSVTVPSIVPTDITVTQGESPASGAWAQGYQEQVRGLVSTDRQDNFLLLLDAWLEGTADEAGVVEVSAFARHKVTSVAAGRERHIDEDHHWQVSRTHASFIPGDPDLLVQLPAFAKVTGEVVLPKAWQNEGVSSYSESKIDRGDLYATSRGSSLNLAVDPRGSRIKFNVTTQGHHAPASFFATTPFEGKSVTSDLVATETVSLRVDVVDHKGNPVPYVLLRTPQYDRAISQQFFTGLARSSVIQSVYGLTNQNGRATLGAFPDRRVRQIEVTTQDGRSASIYDMRLTSDGRLHVVINRQGEPVISAA